MADPCAPAVLDLSDGVATLRFDRPDRQNVLGLEGDAQAISSTVQSLSANPEVRVLLLTGSGRTFSAGGDLKAMHSGALSGPAPDVMSIYRARILPMVQALSAVEWPVIAAVNGPAIGLGCGVSLLADIRIASERAKFAMSFVDLGLVPGDGSVKRLVEIVGYEQAARLLFTGETVSAARAQHLGLVSDVVPDDELEQAALALARTIAAKPPLAIRAAKLLLRAARSHAGDGAVAELSIALQAVLHQTPEFREGVQAIVDRIGVGPRSAQNVAKPKSREE